MKTIGIVAEYNPFHLGHEYHIRESRRLVGDDSSVIAVMSGDFVQRGEPAILSKYARAEAACRSGADLVIELPLPWALSSAEGFARGSVTLLASLGAEVLSFGSETTDLDALKQIAELVSEEEFTEEVVDLLKTRPNMSFAAARQLCAEQRIGKPLPMLQQSNSILAVEYLKELRKNGLPMTPLAVRRRGAGHDERGAGEFPSAAELRSRIRTGAEIAGCVPDASKAVLGRELAAGRVADNPDRLELLMLSRLRYLKEEDFNMLPEAGHGLGKRLFTAVRNENSCEAIVAAAATRRYPRARVQRLCVSACLGLRASDLQGLPPYARVLAFNEKGRTILRNAEEHSQIPLLTKPAHVSALDGSAQHVFRLGADAHDFYTLLYQKEEERSCGADWRTGPAVCL